MGDTPERLERRFDGIPKLERLLAEAGSPCDYPATVALLRAAHSEGAAPRDVFPLLFADEPRFGSARQAEALFSNLLALWERVAAGSPLPEPPPAPRTRPAPEPPPELGEGFSAEALEAAYQWASRLPERERARAAHRLDNTQDFLLGQLFEALSSDAACAQAHALLCQTLLVLERCCGTTVATVRRSQPRDLPIPWQRLGLPAALDTVPTDAGLVRQAVADLVAHASPGGPDRSRGHGKEGT